MTESSFSRRTSVEVPPSSPIFALPPQPPQASYAAGGAAQNPADGYSPTASSFHSTFSSAANSFTINGNANHLHRDHYRQWSSSSSRSSSPPAGSEVSEPPTSFKMGGHGLPKVTEHPMERDSSLDLPLQTVSPDLSHTASRNASRPPSSQNWSVDPPPLRESFYSDDLAWGHQSKRRKSGDSTFSSFKDGLITRFPSLSKRSRDAKRPSQTNIATSSAGSDPPSGRRSRSSSVRSMFRRSGVSDVDVESDLMSPSQTPIETITEDEDPMPDFFLHDQQDGNDNQAVGEALHRESTPILPHMMTGLNQQGHDNEDADEISPLRPPTVVMDGAMMQQPFTPIGTPYLTKNNSPELNGMDGYYHHDSAVDIPTSFLDTTDADPWALRLGHANFHIRPEPFTPEVCDQNSCRNLLAAWDSARREFSHHLARTSTHYGQKSTIYELTEAKWTEIDAQWRANYDKANRQASARGLTPPADSPTEPAPVAKIPSYVNELGHISKFPQLNNGEVYAPMERNEQTPLQQGHFLGAAAVGPTSQYPQSTSGLERKTSKREKFAKILGQLQIPGKGNSNRNSMEVGRAVSSPK